MALRRLRRAGDSPANAFVTPRNDAEDVSNPAATPCYSLTSDPNLSSDLYYVYPRVLDGY